jgi:hypothetical protein
MSDQTQAAADPTSLQNTLFPVTSRYWGLPTTAIQTAQGRTIVYLRRRFVPPPERFQLLQEHTVIQGERLDNIAARYLGDPERFWQICDANNAMQPDELTQTMGRTLRITLPEGIQAQNHA